MDARIGPLSGEARLTIGDRAVGAGEPVFVVAEIGVNHDGSAKRALELVEAAAEAGADAVKVQVFRASSLMHRSAGFAQYQADRCEEADAGSMLRRYELGEDELQKIVGAIRERGMVPLATPFSVGDVEVIDRVGLPAVKIASPDVVNVPLLKRAARLDRPMLISTGAATMGEVARTVDLLREWGVSFGLLHCVSSYPAEASDANLCWIEELRRRFEAPVGYSDHTSEVMAGALAVTAGAVIVEKHLTHNRLAEGPDHSASADPGELRCYVHAIRLAERMRGTAGKRVLECEQDVRRVSRQSLVLRRNVRGGEVLRETDLMTQRPGTGVPAEAVERVIGRRLLWTMRAGEMLTWEAVGIGHASGRQAG